MHHFKLGKVISTKPLIILGLSVLISALGISQAQARGLLIDTPNFSIGYKNHGHYHHRSYKRYPKRYHNHDDYYYDRDRYRKRHYYKRDYYGSRYGYRDDYYYDRCPTRGYSKYAILGLDCRSHGDHYHCYD